MAMSFRLFSGVRRIGARSSSLAFRQNALALGTTPAVRSTQTPLLSSTPSLCSTRFSSSLNTPFLREMSPFARLSSSSPLLQRYYSSNDVIDIEIPPLGDSVTEGTVEQWLKGPGDFVEMDEIVGTIETDKTAQEIRAPESGTIEECYVAEGDTVHVGTKFFRMKLGQSSGGSAAAAPPPPKEEAPAAAPPPPPAQEAPKAAAAPPPPPPPAAAPKAAAPPPPSAAPAVAPGVRVERRVKMTRMRQKIASRLKDAQNVNAMLTTFNDIDMSNLIEMRNKYKGPFEKKHGIKLGFMSPFVKAATMALEDQPAVNAVIDGDEIVYRDYVDVSVAVAAPKGLVVPVIRNCEHLSFADIERSIAEYGDKAKTGKLTVEEMTGGTFTISNGGVFGSLMGTPIINPPQSAILGMHATNKRPVVVNDEIVIRPMMYVALTYDHRLIDGREAVTFLKKIKDLIEDPQRMLLE
eukprot:CAMPEP_0201523374 /NCGR_PEP_ID=MMETSP0161_2-20130828/19608_1 /ASSEMBLY_ACC=CAM_ASM_000251 /TAXON_ID=180227 /ORGANISM="Neoparamoeba aestuarina, Strain SoJaBio B1-5/56/2" /LENGTH=463 /DNA_ID=CAMNT_0047922475 /DNA_START=69 /DNA_END=1460 /DNA_ORIENTATION=+